MKMELFSTKIDVQHRFGVAVPTEGGTMAIIQTYETKELLENDYREWQKYASERGITKPYPIEFLDNNGRCKILTDIL